MQERHSQPAFEAEHLEILKGLEDHLTQARLLLARLAPNGEVLSEASPQSSQEVARLKDLYRNAERRANAAEASLSKLQRSIDQIQQKASLSVKNIERLAFRDEVTGLANSHLMLQHLNHLVANERFGYQVLLLIADIDRFKVINDMLGHQMGDQLLARVGERLSLMTPSGASVGRLGEDEFAIVFPDIPTRDFASRSVELASGVQQCLAQPFSVQGQDIRLTVSQGGSSTPEFAQDAEELIAQARTALSLAKEKGRNQFQIYSPVLRDHLQTNATLELQLKYGLQGDELFLAYLPFFVVEQGPTGALRGQALGVEALLRWKHRTAGLLMPEHFIHLAERSGDIVAIGEWVLREVCQQLQSWKSEGIAFFASLNLSGRQLLESNFSSVAQTEASNFGIAPENVCFEFDEDFGTLNQDFIDQTLSGLLSAGFSLAIDRFGEAASSLARLDQVKFLKLSSKLVNGPPDLCRKAIGVAHSLGLIPIGVGVKDVATAKFLLQCGCNIMQGFLLSEPVEPSALPDLYRKGASFPR